MKEKKIYKQFSAKVNHPGIITIPSVLRSSYDIQENDVVTLKLLTVRKE